MPANYSSPNISGPTASYAGDPNDYSGGTGINANSLVDSIFGNVGNILTGVGTIIGATNGQPVTYVNGQPTYAPIQQQPTPQQTQQSNMVMYIVLAVFFLLLLLAGAYFLTRK